MPVEFLSHNNAHRSLYPIHYMFKYKPSTGTHGANFILNSASMLLWSKWIGGRPASYSVSRFEGLSVSHCSFIELHWHPQKSEEVQCKQSYLCIAYLQICHSMHGQGLLLFLHVQQINPHKAMECIELIETYFIFKNKVKRLLGEQFIHKQ